MEGLPWRLSMPGSAMRKRNWACPECAEECEPEWPKVIDELQAEVHKLKGKVRLEGLEWGPSQPLGGRTASYAS